MSRSDGWFWRRLSTSSMGASINVDQVLTRIPKAKTRLFRSGSKYLLYCKNLVAGAGFEPAAFRL